MNTELVTRSCHFPVNQISVQRSYICGLERAQFSVKATCDLTAIAFEGAPVRMESNVFLWLVETMRLGRQWRARARPRVVKVTARILWEKLARLAAAAPAVAGHSYITDHCSPNT